ncbi:hypothetical protein BDL97_06G021200 [Sphagnum fallax]|nr:hypothetical protein BDL97_06G021200 [Sphagnum fallax]
MGISKLVGYYKAMHVVDKQMVEIFYFWGFYILGVLFLFNLVKSHGLKTIHTSCFDLSSFSH